MLCIGMLTHQPGLFRQYSCTVLLDWPFLAFLCSHAMLCGLCKIMWFDAGMRSSSHTLYNWVWTYAADKSMCMQVPSVDLWMKLFFLVLRTAKLYIPAMIAIIKYSWLQIVKECMLNHRGLFFLGSLNLCHQKKYLWCLYQQQDGKTALILACKKEDVRNVDLLLKASADPNHITKVSIVGKMYLLQLINFPNF